MTNFITHQQQVKQTIEHLIETASHFDLEKLDLIYHNDMQVVMVDPTGTKHTADKTAFKQMIQASKDEGVPMNTWAQFHHVEADAKNGLVVLSRKNNLAGQDMLLNLTIELRFESDRWQVVREVIFLHPDNN